LRRWDGFGFVSSGTGGSGNQMQSKNEDAQDENPKEERGDEPSALARGAGGSGAGRLGHSERGRDVGVGRDGSFDRGFSETCDRGFVVAAQVRSVISWLAFRKVDD
jgi:hypothetical protein